LERERDEAEQREQQRQSAAVEWARGEPERQRKAKAEADARATEAEAQAARVVAAAATNSWRKFWICYFGYLMPIIVVVLPPLVMEPGHVWPLPDGIVVWAVALTPGLNWIMPLGLVAFVESFRVLGATVLLGCGLVGSALAALTKPS
jgi:hypothetical protein